jgi:hypothetical protein
MSGVSWLPATVGLDADRWATRSGCRTVLVLGHTVVSVQRLLDVVGLIESDLAVQVLYTQVPDAFGNGTEEFLRSLDVLPIPWEHAVHQRFDLALSAAYGGLERVHAPVMVLPHGAGYGKRASGAGGAAGAVYGLDAQRLVRDGRLVADAVVLSHHAQRRVLVRQCRQAALAALVAGDPCYDRMAAALPHRAAYREALGVPEEARLVVVASTWGTRSLFGRHAELLPALMTDLDPRRYRVAALLHPAAWFGHGPRQIRAWLSDAQRAGLLVVDPRVDWRAAVVAADCVLGDHGSTTVYAAALGVPVLHVEAPPDDLDPGSPQAWLAEHAPRLVSTGPVEPQIRAAIANPVAANPVPGLLTSRPGRAHQVLRGRMYELIGLPVPGRHRAPEPVPLPERGFRRG